MSHTITIQNRMNSLFVTGLLKLQQQDILPEESDHPMEDIQFLERLDAQKISAQERTELLDHLAKCHFCRERLLTLIECGALFDEEPEVVSPPVDGTKVAKIARDDQLTYSRHRKNLWILVSSCAILTLVLILPFLKFGKSTQLAKKELENLLTLGEKSTSTLLCDNGYRLNGTLYTKGIPMLDERTTKIVTIYEQLIADSPNDISGKLDFARFLIYSHRDSDRAKEVLKSILTAKNISATELATSHLWMGLAEFESKNNFAATEQFRKALNLDADNLAAKLNLGITLYRIGNTAEAIAIFQELKKQPISDQLKEQIESLINQNN